jgi:UTP--glucose-1-phosphate uridylyltransferase
MLAPMSTPMKSDRNDLVLTSTRGLVRHAVFPVAGLGTALLPATKACPKEMLPIVDRPMIQYAVEEAAAAGLTRMIFVTGRGKRAIEDHFDRAYELEHQLTARDDSEALEILRATVPAGITFSYVRQREPSGLLDAVRMARPLIGDEPFAVVLPDQLFDSDRPALSQLIDVYALHRSSVMGAERVRTDTRDGSHVVGAELDTGMKRSVSTLVHVPPVGAGFASLASAGRFVFTRAAWESFDHAANAGASGSPLIAAIRNLMGRERVFACVIDGRRYDCGSRLGYLDAQIAFARKRPEFWNAMYNRVESVHGPQRGRERAVGVIADAAQPQHSADAAL